MDRRSLLTGGAGFVGATFAMPHIARAAPISMRFAHFAAEDHPAHLAAKRFVAQVTKRTNGAVKITIYPNNALGDPAQQAQQIRAGVIDMGLPTQGQLDKYDKAFGAVPLPFIFDNRELVYKVLDGPAMDWLAPLAAKQGFIMLRNWDYGFRNITNNKRPINVPADVKGMKIRTPPEIQIEAAMQAIGGIVTAISFPEVYLALSQGVVDAEENPIAVIYFNKYYEVQKHLALTRHVYNNMIHTMSAAAWKKLDSGQQTIFREESTKAGDFMRAEMARQEETQLSKLAAGGLQITRPDLAPFRAMMEPAYQKISGFAGADNVAKFRAMVDKARKS